MWVNIAYACYSGLPSLSTSVHTYAGFRICAAMHELGRFVGSRQHDKRKNVLKLIPGFYSGSCEERR